VILDPTRLAIFLLSDRLVAVAIQRRRVEAFVVDAENSAAALRAELDQRRLAPRTVAIGLPRASVTVKPIELPSVGGELRDMVRFELERHLPSGGDDSPFDYLPLPPESDGGPAPAAQEVLIAAADRRVVDGALRIAEDAKLRPVSITVASHNLTALVPRQRRGRVVWVHRVGDGTDLLFLSGPTLVLSRTLPEADHTVIADAIRRSFVLAHWRGCDAIWISGDATADAAGALADLGAPVTEPPFTSSARQRLAAITETPRGAFDLALAVASAGRVRPLELIPPALRPRHLTRPQMMTAGMLAATLLLGLGALLVPGYQNSRRLADLNARIARLDPEVRAVEKVVQELDRKRRLLATVQSIESTTIRPLPVVRELTELLPTDAWLTMLALDTKGVELTGQAAAAAALIPLLENSPRFERVEFSSPVTRGRDREQFRIRATWEAAPSATVAGAPASATPPTGRPPTLPPLPTQRPGPPTVGAPAEPPQAPLPEGLPMQPRRSFPPTAIPGSGAR
jgi:Tfp pilus assembly protein PilN